MGQAGFGACSTAWVRLALTEACPEGVAGGLMGRILPKAASVGKRCQRCEVISGG